jgi:serine phosphatase RsbU (regulator of sigma subunit)
MLAGLGVLFILIVMVSALAGLARVAQEDRQVDALSRAARAHQDADMAHDALHSDVTRLLVRAPDATEAESRALIRQELALYRTSLERLEQSALPAAIAPERAALIAQERAYMADAEQQADTPLPSPATSRQALAPFDRSFAVLVAPLASFTDQLAGLQEAARDRSDRAHRAAQRLVFIAAAAAIAALLALTRLLSRMTARLAQSEVQREVATTLQRSLLPPELPTRSGLQCAARYLPTSIGADIGGDWYDVFTLPDGNLALVMGDVVGHDVQAASFMGKLRSALRAYALEGHCPSEVLARLNNFTHHLYPGVMATCIYAVYTPDKCALTWANAGHFPPLLAVPDAPAEYLQGEAQPPIGAMEDIPYRDWVRCLPPGSRLLLFTDGLIEARSPTGEFIDPLPFLAEVATADFDTALDGLLTSLQQAAGHALEDDLALLLACYDPE